MFCFVWATLGGAQDLLLTLHSRIIFRGCLGTMYGPWGLNSGLLRASKTNDIVSL